MSIWVVFALATTLLILGYSIYGVFVSKVFGVDETRPTPVKELADCRDYIEMPNWKIFLIQLLNIAGLGPVFGPLLGALYGPMALFWIVFGCIFAGAVHDYFSGMLSVRHKGISLPNICGIYLGKIAQDAMIALCLIVLILTGMVFVTGPAALLSELFGHSKGLWLALIFGYYFISTVLPIDKVIGKIYPLFGGILILTAVSLLGTLAVDSNLNTIPASFWTSGHPSGHSAWPLLFITIACGAVSGFHSTQSPIMARCIANEKYGRQIFYGAMIGEGLIAMVWVLLGVSFYNNGFATAFDWTNSVSVAESIASYLLGPVGRLLAIIGVVILPITSGDTAFRSARLIVADTFKIDQKSNLKCIMVALPLFATGYICNMIGFEKLWHYFGWSNQTLATIVLWLSAIYLKKRGNSGLIAIIPAMFMTSIVGTFFFNNKLMHICLPLGLSTILSIGLAILLLVLTLHTKVEREAVSNQED